MSEVKKILALVCLWIFVLFSVIPAALIMLNANSQIKVAFTLTEEERKCSFDEKSLFETSLFAQMLTDSDRDSNKNKFDLDDERWLLKPIYYDVISPPPELV